jgi:hypothetical protein
LKGRLGEGARGQPIIVYGGGAQGALDSRTGKGARGDWKGARGKPFAVCMGMVRGAGAGGEGGAKARSTCKHTLLRACLAGLLLAVHCMLHGVPFNQACTTLTHTQPLQPA